MNGEYTSVWKKWEKEKVDVDTNWKFSILGICLSCNLEAVITTLYLIFFQTHFKTFARSKTGGKGIMHLFRSGIAGCGHCAVLCSARDQPQGFLHAS